MPNAMKHLSVKHNAFKTSFFTSPANKTNRFNGNLGVTDTPKNNVSDSLEISAKALTALKTGILNDDETNVNKNTWFEEFLKTEEESFNKLFQSILNQPAREAENQNENNSGVDDPTRKLTRRLVAASNINQVHTVLSEAYKAMGEVIQAMAHGDENATNILRRLNKLIRRATRKVRDLNNEDQLKVKEARAREKEIQELARQIEMELKRKYKERKQREKKYLQDKDHDDNETTEIPSNISMPSSAQIKAMAYKAAQAAVASYSSALTGTGSSDSGGFGNTADGNDAGLSGESSGEDGGTSVSGEVEVV